MTDSRQAVNNYTAASDRGRGRPPLEDIKLLPPVLLPMDDEKRKEVVVALARLLVSWFEERRSLGDQGQQPRDSGAGNVILPQ